MNSQLSNSSCQILYGYVNSTRALQIIRIVNIPDWYLERVIFPGQRLLFEAKPDAELEVYTTYLGQAVLVKKIPVLHLQVKLRSD